VDVRPQSAARVVVVEARHEGLDQLLVAATAIQNLERVSWIRKQAVEGEAMKDFLG
jgi:hypothetical protein